MGGLRGLIAIVLCILLPAAAQAQDRLVRLHAPDPLIDTGLLKHILPRFSLKTQVRVQLVATPAAADLVLGGAGEPLFLGLGQTWHMAVRQKDHPGTRRLADWLTSPVGQRAITGFAPAGQTLFAPPDQVATQAVAPDLAGDAALGLRVSRDSCARCHAVDDESRMAGIGSTPSFAVLRSLPDWEDRFTAFYALKPHAAFTLIEDVTPPFPEDRPPPIVPITLTLDEVEAVLAYVAAMDAADLGAPLAHQ